MIVVEKNFNHPFAATRLPVVMGPAFAGATSYAGATIRRYKCQVACPSTGTVTIKPRK